MNNLINTVAEIFLIAHDSPISPQLQKTVVFLAEQTLVAYKCTVYSV